MLSSSRDIIMRLRYFEPCPSEPNVQTPSPEAPASTEEGENISSNEPRPVSRPPAMDSRAIIRRLMNPKPEDLNPDFLDDEEVNMASFGTPVLKEVGYEVPPYKLFDFDVVPPTPEDIIKTLNPEQKWNVVTFGKVATFTVNEYFHRVLNFKTFGEALQFCREILDTSPFRPAENIAIQLKPKWIANKKPADLEKMVQKLMEFIDEYDHMWLMKFYVFGFAVKEVNDYNVNQHAFNKIMKRRLKNRPDHLRFLNLTHYLPLGISYYDMYTQYGPFSGHINDDLNEYLVQRAITRDEEKFKSLEKKLMRDLIDNRHVQYDLTYLLNHKAWKEAVANTPVVKEDNDSEDEEKKKKVYVVQPDLCNVSAEITKHVVAFYRTNRRLNDPLDSGLGSLANWKLPDSTTNTQ